MVLMRQGFTQTQESPPRLAAQERHSYKLILKEQQSKAAKNAYLGTRFPHPPVVPRENRVDCIQEADDVQPWPGSNRTSSTGAALLILAAALGGMGVLYFREREARTRDAERRVREEVLTAQERFATAPEGIPEIPAKHESTALPASLLEAPAAETTAFSPGPEAAPRQEALWLTGAAGELEALNARLRAGWRTVQVVPLTGGAGSGGRILVIVERP